MPLMIVDGNAICWKFVNSPRSFDGRFLGPLHGLINYLLHLERQFETHRTLLVFDGGISEMRQSLFSEYKANRKPSPERAVMSKAIVITKFALESIGANHVTVNGVEADDIISIVAERCRERNVPTLIVSDDKDLFQCLGGSVQRFSPRDHRVYTAQESMPEFDGDRRAYLLYLALAGDRQTDNVPGMAGIGKKRATELVMACKGQWRNLFSPAIQRIYGGSKAFASLFAPNSKELFLEQVRLVKTCTAVDELAGLRGDNLLSSSQVRVSIQVALQRLSAPHDLSPNDWNRFLRRYELFSLYRDVDRVARLFAFRIHQPSLVTLDS